MLLIKVNTLALTAIAGAALASTASAGTTPPLYGVMFRTAAQTAGIGPNLYDVNPVTGAATNVRALNVNNCVDIAIDPATGVMYGLTDQFGRINNVTGQGGKNLIFTIDPDNGFCTAVGRLDPAGVFQEFEGDIDFNPVTGQLWGVTTQVTGATLYTVDVATGLATPGAVIAPPLGNTDLDISGLAFAPNGDLYALDTRYPSNPGPARIYKLDAATGAILNSYESTLTLGNCAGIAFDPGTGDLFAADGDTGGTAKLYKFDFGASNFTEIGPTGAAGGIYVGLAGLAFGYVPEPGSALAFGLATMALGLRRRRA